MVFESSTIQDGERRRRIEGAQRARGGTEIGTSCFLTRKKIALYVPATSWKNYSVQYFIMLY